MINNSFFTVDSGDGIRTHTVEILSLLSTANWTTPPGERQL